MFGKKSENLPPAQLPGRNDPCHCGSGKKYKKCHEDKDAAATHTVLEKKWAESEKVAAAKAEEEKKEAAKQQSTTNTPHRPAQQSQQTGPKHNTMTVPKFNMPRKTGGGGA
jgi:hypothetical protein